MVWERIVKVWEDMGGYMKVLKCMKKYGRVWEGKGF